MKKIVSILLVLAMMAALCITVAAANLTSGVTNTGDGKNGNVSVSVNKDTDATNVYNVTVNWNSLAFTFDADEWNPATNSYTGSWANGGKSSIDVTNKSNAAITVAAAFGDQNSAEKNGVTATLTNNTFPLASAAAAGAATTGSVVVTVTGEPQADSIDVGTITLTISTNN